MWKKTWWEGHKKMILYAPSISSFFWFWCTLGPPNAQRPRFFYGHSFMAPTPSISTIQLLSLCISKSFVSHVWYASLKFSDHPTVVQTPHRHTPQRESISPYHPLYQFIPMMITINRTLSLIYHTYDVVDRFPETGPNQQTTVLLFAAFRSIV